jgi:hypothetical protein
MYFCMRTLLIAACCALQLCAAEDPKEMVRRALAAYTHDDAAERQYTYLQREDMRMLDGAGNTKQRKLQTWDVTPVEGSPYKRLVKRNDQPLSAEEEKQQQDSLQWNIEQRRKETPEQRRQRIAEWERKRQEQLKDIQEVPDAFDFRLVGQETVDGVPTWVVEGTPHPGYHAKSRTSSFFGKMRGRMWISQGDYHAVKMDAVTLDTISIGAFLLRVAKGGHIVVEFAHVNNEVWLPKHASLKGSARLLFVKGYHLDADWAFTDYRKFTVESHVVNANR